MLSSLYEGAKQQVRDVGELAFMELELAVESFKWSLWTMLLFAVASIMTLTLLMVSLLLLFPAPGGTGGDSHSALQPGYCNHRRRPVPAASNAYEEALL